MHCGFILGLLILSFFVLEKWLRNKQERRCDNAVVGLLHGGDI